MIKFLKSNWREAVAVFAGIAILLIGILSLGTREVSEDGTLSAALSLTVSLIGGVTKFAVCLALAWSGLMVTFPEANKFILHDEFDRFWECLHTNQRGIIALSGVGILAIVAALCMASS